MHHGTEARKEQLAEKQGAGLLSSLISFVNGLLEPAGKSQLHSIGSKRGSMDSQYWKGLCCCSHLAIYSLVVSDAALWPSCVMGGQAAQPRGVCQAEPCSQSAAHLGQVTTTL